ncbi:MAG: MFS transporter [Solirubrobacterales bacterium]
MRRLFALVATVVLVDTMFYAAITPLLPHYVDDLGLSKSAAGVLSASYAAGTLIGSLPSGWLAARIGVRPTMLTGLTLLASSSLAFAFAGNVLVLDLARFTQGIGGACAWTGGLAWLLAATPRDRRGELIGSALAAAIAGVLLGPVLGGAATVAGPEPVFSTVAVVAAGLAAWAAVTPGVAPSPPPGVRRVAGALLAAPVLAGFWLVALPALLAGTLNVLAPLRLDELGASGLAVGGVFLVAAAVEALVSRAFGRVSDRRGRLWPIRLGLAASAVVALLLPLPATVALLGAAVIAAVIALGLLWAPAMALLADASEATGLDHGFAFALVNLAWAGGQVLGGSGGAALAEATSDAVPYVLVGALFALTLAPLLARHGLPGRPSAGSDQPRVEART